MNIFERLELKPIPDNILDIIRGPVYTGFVSRQHLVNYIRHHLTNYDALCAEFRLQGVHRKILRGRFNDRIREAIKAHPVLSRTNTWPHETKAKARRNRQAQRSGRYDEVEPLE